MISKILKAMFYMLLCVGSIMQATVMVQAQDMKERTIAVENAEIVSAENEDILYSDETITEGKWSYQILDDGTVAIVGYDMSSEDETLEELQIPSELGGMTVTKVDGGFFYPRPCVKAVIPDTVIEFSLSYFCTKVEVAENNPIFENIGEHVYTKDTKKLVFCAKDTEVLNIAEGTLSLGNFSMANCYKIKVVNIPASVNEIHGIYSFSGADYIEEINVDEANETYSSDMGVVYDKEKTQLIACPKMITKIVFPDTVSDIDLVKEVWRMDIHEEWTSVKEIVLPYNLEDNSMLSLGVNLLAFPNLEKVTVKNPYCSLYVLSQDNIVICGWENSTAQEFALEEGDTFESLGQLEFGVYGKADGTLILNSYRGTETEIILPSEFDGKKVTGVGGKQNGYSSITKVTLPEGITTIEKDAFENSSLQEINFPQSLKVIDEDAFYNCNLSGNIVIPGYIESVGAWAFGWCDKITEITIEEGVSEFGEGVFTSCNGVKSVQLPNSVTQIADKMFLDCKGLESVTIPDTVTSVGFGAFAGCSNLKKMVLPENIKSIDNAAFSIGDYMKPWEVGDGWLTLTLHNSECEIYDDKSTMYYVNKIIAHENSTAHQYAEKYGITFVDLDNPFADVPKSGWEYAPVEYALEKGLMAGNGTDEDGKIIFKPSDSITREQFVQVIYSNSGKPEANIENKFPDVQNDWYTSAVLWANENSIANGNGDGTFGVGQNITREQLALMLYKYAQMNGYDLTTAEGQINQYADGTMVSTYAKDALNWAITQGIISGKGTVGEDISTFRIDPQGTATRAECAAMMKKLLTNN